MPDRKTKKAVRNGAGKRGRSSPTTGSYFLSLELENVRCFSARQTLDLSDGNGRPARWTILLGENGTGKTTILQLLAVMSISEPLPDGDTKAARNRFVSRPFLSVWGSLIRAGLEGIAQVFCRIVQETSLFGDTQRGFRSVSSLEFERGKYSWTARESEIIPVIYPTCFAYSVDRRLSHPSLQQEDFIDTAEGLFLETSSIWDVEGWLLRLDYASSKNSRIQRQQKRRLEMAKDVLIKILPDVSEIRFNASSGVLPAPHAEFKTPYGWVPLRQLGYGYRTMIAWILDLAARMVERYPDSPDPLAEPAVVLVDEIDLHLHPKWQRDVIGYLTERFPNTQFIATSHSPLIVQAAAGAKIALLKREGDHVVIENHPETLRGWRVDQVLTSELFGLETARPPDMEKLLRRRKEILTKPRLTRAEQKELEAINDQIGPIASGESFDEAKKTMDLIERSIELVKKYQGTKT